MGIARIPSEDEQEVLEPGSHEMDVRLRYFCFFGAAVEGLNIFEGHESTEEKIVLLFLIN